MQNLLIMRPTYLEFRNPNQKTPGAYYPKVTYVGKNLGFVSGSIRGTFSQTRRFKQYEVDAKRTPCKVGPGYYSCSSLELTKPRNGVPIFKGFQVGKSISNNGFYYNGNNLVFEKAFVLKSRSQSQEKLPSSASSKRSSTLQSHPKSSKKNRAPQKSKPKKRPASAKPRP